AAGVDAAAEALVRHERPALLQRRYARPFSVHTGRPVGGAGGGAERGQPAALAVGPPVHQRRGVDRPATCLAGWPHYYLCHAGEPPAYPGPPHPAGPDL